VGLHAASMLMEFTTLAISVVHMVNVQLRSGHPLFSETILLVAGSCVLTIFSFFANLVGARKVLLFTRRGVRVAVEQSRAVRAQVALAAQKSRRVLDDASTALRNNAAGLSFFSGRGDNAQLAAESECTASEDSSGSCAGDSRTPACCSA
jgi:hypothetical protein